MKRVVVVVASLLLGVCVYVSVFGVWYGRNVVDQDAFTEHALASFEREGSYAALGEIVADKVIAEYPGLALFGSSLATLFGALLATPPFQDALEELARDMHERLLEETRAPVVVDLERYRDEVVGGFNAFAPGLMELVPDDAFREYTLFDEGAVPGVADETERLRTYTVGAVIVGALAAVSIAVAAASMGERFVAFGFSLLAAGGAILVLTPMTRETLRVAVPDEADREVVLNLFDTITESVPTLATVLVVAGLGLLIAGGVLLLRRRRSGQSSGQPLHG